MPNIRAEMNKIKVRISNFLEENNLSDPLNRDWCAQHLKLLASLHMLAEQKGGADNDFEPKEQGAILESPEWKNNPAFVGMIREIGKKRHIEDYAANPAKLLEDYKERKYAYDKAKELEAIADKKDYAGVVNTCLDLVGTNDEKNGIAITQFFRNYIIPKEGEAFDKEKVDVLFRAVTDKLSEFIVEAEKEKEKNLEKVKQGKYPEFALYAGDQKAEEELAAQIMWNQSEVGDKLRRMTVILQTFKDPISEITDKVEVDGKRLAVYNNEIRAKNIVDYMKEHNQPELAEKLKYFNNIEEYVNAPLSKKSIKGFKVKLGQPKEGESIFSVIPEEVQKLNSMSDHELLMFEQEKLDRKALEASLKNDKTYAQSVNPLLEEMQQFEVPEDANEKKRFDVLLAEMKNFQKVGTTEYVRGGNIGFTNEVKAKENYLTTYGIQNSLSRMNYAAKEYEEFNPEFSQKVQGFVWAQKQKYEHILNDPDKDIKQDLIDRVKKSRGLEGKTIDNDLMYATKMEKVPGMFKAARKKFNDAKLLGGLRGSSEYREVGNIMDKLEDDLDFLLVHEKRNRDVRKDDPDHLGSRRAAMERVQQRIQQLKEKTAKYFEHKGKDGQWVKGTNANADKRIEAVQALDKFADYLNDTLESKQKSLETEIQKAEQKQITDQRNELKAKLPDCKAWCALWPYTTEDYTQNHEKVPYGLKAFEDTVLEARTFMRQGLLLEIPMEQAGHSEEFQKLNHTTTKLSQMMRPHADLKSRNVTEQQWNNEMNYQLKEFKKQICEGDNYIHLAEAADKHAQMTGNKDLHTKMISGLNAMNDLFHLDIPVAELEQKYQVHKQVQSFKEQAAEVYVRNLHRTEIEAYIQQHPEYNTEEKKKLVFEANPIPDDWFKQKKELLLQDETFNAYINTIKTPEDLTHAKHMAETNGGAALYDYIREVKFRPVNLDQKLAAAKQSLQNKKAAAGENQYPEKQAAEKEYAEITAVHLLIKKNKTEKKQITEQDFEDMVQDLRQNPFFKEELIGGKLSAEALYTKATTGNGRDIYFAAGNAKTEYNNRKANEAKAKRMGLALAQGEIKAEQPGLAGRKTN